MRVKKEKTAGTLFGVLGSLCIWVVCTISASELSVLRFLEAKMFGQINVLAILILNGATQAIPLCDVYSHPQLDAFLEQSGWVYAKLLQETLPPSRPFIFQSGDHLELMAFHNLLKITVFQSTLLIFPS